jgi:hypothetical protein
MRNAVIGRYVRCMRASTSALGVQPSSMVI